MTQVNYNDGKWHGWNGGECPVHPKSYVESMSWAGCRRQCDAGSMNWKDEAAQSHVIAFRVIKEHREPREWWIGCNGFAYSVREAAEDSLKGTLVDPIHVREVLK